MNDDHGAPVIISIVALMLLFFGTGIWYYASGKPSLYQPVIARQSIPSEGPNYYPQTYPSPPVQNSGMISAFLVPATGTIAQHIHITWSDLGTPRKDLFKNTGGYYHGIETITVDNPITFYDDFYLQSGEDCYYMTWTSTTGSRATISPSECVMVP